MHYQFLYFDSFGHIIGGMECDASEDLVALEKAQTGYHAGPLEIWDGERCVARLMPDGGADTSAARAHP
ncbi:MAG TPA: hypothetical protein VGG10_18785 [Rhizomicrobium sp.]|jgi:hypothetical protein